MRVLHVAAEAFPLIKTGGLADVAGALPAAQRRLGADARLLLPGYPEVVSALDAAGAFSGADVDVGAAMGAARVRLRAASMPVSGLPLLVLDAPWYFGRPGNPYLGADGLPWDDNHRRFGLFCWTAAQIAAGELVPGWQPQVVHAHDWHAGLALATLAQHPAASARRVFTIHNLAYQGCFPLDAAADLGVPSSWLTPERLEFHGALSFMKAGIVGAHRITTVSPTYAREILRQDRGEGLDGLLRRHADALVGILNGIDEAVWDPATDPELPQRFHLEDLAGKRVGRRELQRTLGLDDGDGLVLALVGRLTEQKGVDTVLAAMPELLSAGCRLAVLGSGDPALEQALRAAAAANPGRISVTTRYDEALAHRIIGGADAILVPSRFEPCGLTQMYGLRYGTVPVVRRVGGLADTVVDEAEGSPARKGNGFVYDRADGLADAVRRAVDAFGDPVRWQALVAAGMQARLGWADPARRYLDSYGPDPE